MTTRAPRTAIEKVYLLAKQGFQRRTVHGENAGEGPSVRRKRDDPHDKTHQMLQRQAIFQRNGLLQRFCMVDASVLDLSKLEGDPLWLINPPRRKVSACHSQSVRRVSIRC